MKGKRGQKRVIRQISEGYGSARNSSGVGRGVGAAGRPAEPDGGPAAGGEGETDPHAEGIVAAAREVKLEDPLVVRLEGTNVEQGKKILETSGLKIIPADNLRQAAEKAVAAAK